MTSPDPMATGEYSHAEVSAILRRAIDVASDHSFQDERLTAADLEAVAGEVGLPPGALATALAESRAGLGQARGRLGRLIDRLVGPSKVGASRRLPVATPPTEGTPPAVAPPRPADGQPAIDAEAAANLEPATIAEAATSLEPATSAEITADVGTATAAVRRWLEIDHGLNTHIDGHGVIVAAKRSGVVGAISSGFRRIQGTGGLNRARSVRAATAAVAAEGAVCVVADISNRRVEAIAGGSIVGGGSMVVIGIVSLVAAPAAAVALPVAAAAGLATARLTHRSTVRQVEAQVEATTSAATGEAVPVHPVARLLRVGRRIRPLHR